MGKVPEFKDSEEEARYWDKESIVDHLDELEPVDHVEVREPLVHTLSIRLTVEDMEQLRELGKRRGLGITTMARTLVRQGLQNPEVMALLDQDVRAALAKLAEQVKMPGLLVLQQSQLDALADLVKDKLAGTPVERGAMTNQAEVGEQPAAAARA